ncbi:hypothetical protein CFP56_035802 [Quercus suber]|uniref:Uncharacterized protein n=1 Tax=Quercus suber TaxID=58331 RepID=A0AAW0LPV1_QUESU
MKQDMGASSGVDWQCQEALLNCWRKCGKRNTLMCSRFSHLCLFTHQKTSKCPGPHTGLTCSERGRLPSLA